MNEHQYYRAIIAPKKEMARIDVSHVYWPRETIWELRRGAYVAKGSYAHETTFNGVYCVVGYCLPENEHLIDGVGKQYLRVLTSLWPMAIGSVAVDYWKLLVKSEYIDFAREHEEKSAANPHKPKAFVRGDIVVSSEWYLEGKSFRVKRSDAFITMAREASSGILTQLKTSNLSLVE